MTLNSRGAILKGIIIFQPIREWKDQQTESEERDQVDSARRPKDHRTNEKSSRETAELRSSGVIEKTRELGPLTRDLRFVSGRVYRARRASERACSAEFLSNSTRGREQERERSLSIDVPENRHQLRQNRKQKESFSGLTLSLARRQSRLCYFLTGTSNMQYIIYTICNIERKVMDYKDIQPFALGVFDMTDAFLLWEICRGVYCINDLY